MIRGICILLVHCVLVVHPSHFYGGTVTWKPMVINTTSSTIPVMFTQSYQWRRSYDSSTYCNDSIILNQTPKIGTTGQLTCVSSSSACGGYQALSVTEYCTDYSTLVDSSSGLISNIENITVGSQFCVAYQGNAWTTLATVSCSSSRRRKRDNGYSGNSGNSGYSGNSGNSGHSGNSGNSGSGSGCSNSTAAWSIGTCVDLSIRPDGFINTPPVATVISPIQVSVNTLTNIKIPVIDANDDFLRCRWAANTSELDECGDVCNTAPGGTLNSTDCSLLFNSAGKTVGSVYAVALMVSDFYNSTTTNPLSSVPIQFLIEIVGTPNCSVKPVITANLSECIAVEVGAQYNFTLTIIPGCSGITIADVFTMPPLYMYKGNLTQVGSSNVWTVTETWIPDSSQLGSQVYCAVATDSAGTQSDQYCLTFTVVAAGSVLLCPGQTTTTTITTTTTSTTVTTKTTTTSTASTTKTTTTESTTATTKTTSTTTSTTTTTTSSTTVSTSSTTVTTTSTTTTSTQSLTTTTDTTTTTTSTTTSTSTTSSTTSTTTSTSSTTTTTTTTSTTTITTTTSTSTTSSTTSTTTTTSITTTTSTTTTTTTSTTTTTTTTTTTETTTTSTTTTTTTTTTETTTTSTTTSNAPIQVSTKPHKSPSINIPLIIGLSLLSLLAILCCCGCCWWWLFGGGLRRCRRRRRRCSREPNELRTNMIQRDRKTWLKRILPWLFKKLNDDSIDKSTPSIVYYLNDERLNSQQSRLTNYTTLSATNSDAKVTRINRNEKPKSSEGNRNIKNPLQNSASSIKTRRSSSVSVTKLPRECRVSNELMKPSFSPQLNFTSNGRSASSITVTKLKRISTKKQKIGADKRITVINVPRRALSTCK